MKFPLPLAKVRLNHASDSLKYTLYFYRTTYLVKSNEKSL